MELQENMQYQEQEIDIDEMKANIQHDLPKGIKKAINRFNEIVLTINAYEEVLDSLTPVQLSKLEIFYNKAEREAWRVAGYYKSQYTFWNGKAEVERGNSYVYEREFNKRAVNDANYRSRINEGEAHSTSGIYEGYYTTWRGIAISYEGARNSLKDMVNAIKEEQ